MNYEQQQEYFARSRFASFYVGASLLIFGWWFAWNDYMRIGIGLIATAISATMLYVPDYLRLTVIPNKGARWQSMIRWRLIIVVLLAAIIFARQTTTSFPSIMVAVSWLAISNLVTRRMPRKNVPLWLFGS